PEPNHFNQAAVLELTGPYDAEALKRAVLALCRHHDALRLRVESVEGEWVQRFAGLDDSPALTVEPSRDWGDAMAFTARAAQIHASLNLQSGPVAQFS